MRVVVADDVMLTREGVVRLLRDASVEVVGEAENADGLLRQVATMKPDAAVVDIRMPPTHTDEGIVAARRIRAEYPSVGILVLSHYVEPDYALRLLEDHPEGMRSSPSCALPVARPQRWRSVSAPTRAIRGR